MTILAKISCRCSCPQGQHSLIRNVHRIHSTNDFHCLCTLESLDALAFDGRVVSEGASHFHCLWWLARQGRLVYFKTNGLQPVKVAFDANDAHRQESPTRFFAGEALIGTLINDQRTGWMHSMEDTPFVRRHSLLVRKE